MKTATTPQTAVTIVASPEVRARFDVVVLPKYRRVWQRADESLPRDRDFFHRARGGSGEGFGSGRLELRAQCVDCILKILTDDSPVVGEGPSVRLFGSRAAVVAPALECCPEIERAGHPGEK